MINIRVVHQGGIPMIMVTSGAIALPVIIVVLLCLSLNTRDGILRVRYGVAAAIAFVFNVLCAVCFYSWTTAAGAGMTIWLVLGGFFGLLIVAVASAASESSEQ